MTRFIKKQLTRERIFIYLIMLGAFLGAIGIPQRLGFPSDQTLLALLGILAVDMLVERLGYLEKIEARITEIEKKIEPRTDDLFRTRQEVPPPFPSWLQECEEMWVSGKDLVNLLRQYGRQIQEAAQTKKKCFRFLILDPDDQELMEIVARSTGLYLGPEERAAGIHEALAILGRIVEDTPRDAVQVRLANWVPTHTHVIVDGRTHRGRMIVEMFGFRIAAGERLHITLTRAKDPRTFEYHLEQFERMWDADGVKRLFEKPL